MIEEQNQKFFPAQGENEKVILLLRRHWFTYLAFAGLGLLLFVPLVGFIIYWIANFQNFSTELNNILAVGMCVYAMVFLALMLYGFVDYYLDVHIVTDNRIVEISQNGFFRRNISELHLQQIEDVNAKVDGVFPTMFQFGEVVIQTAGEHENFIFRSIPHPYVVSKKIMDLHQAFIEQMPEGEKEELLTNNINRYDEQQQPPRF